LFSGILENYFYPPKEGLYGHRTTIIDKCSSRKILRDIRLKKRLSTVEIWLLKGIILTQAMFRAILYERLKVTCFFMLVSTWVGPILSLRGVVRWGYTARGGNRLFAPLF
jgi:hypothetical protein